MSHLNQLKDQNRGTRVYKTFCNHWLNASPYRKPLIINQIVANHSPTTCCNSQQFIKWTLLIRSRTYTYHFIHWDAKNWIMCFNNDIEINEIHQCIITYEMQSYHTLERFHQIKSFWWILSINIYSNHTYIQIFD